MIRQATPEDGPACAAILNDWIDETPWRPRVHSHASVRTHYGTRVLTRHRVDVVGDPVAGFLALDDDGCITDLYLAPEARGRGLGRAPLDRAKRDRDALYLWTFQANDGACRFYESNGFRETARTGGDNEEGLPDIRYAWRA